MDVNFDEPPFIEPSLPIDDIIMETDERHLPPFLELSDFGMIRQEPPLPVFESTRLPADDIFMQEPDFDASFDLTRQHDFTAPIQERSIADAPLSDTLLPEEDVIFEVIEEGSNKRRKKLVNSDGYSFTVKKSSSSVTQWRCSVRNKTLWCHASVTQRGDTFRLGIHRHNHAPDNLIIQRIKIKRDVMRQAKESVFRSASDIVETAMHDHLQPTDFNLPKPSNLVRAANRSRQTLRPKEPTDLNFTIDQNSLKCEEFLIGDVRVGDERHIMFATQQQLTLLRQARRWYLDGTFKIRKDPFQQLFSIHAFVQKDNSMKQVPPVFVLMSKRRAHDYQAVLERLLEVMDGVPDVEGVVMDFEAGMWKAVRTALPTINIKGCCFHWAQAVLRKVADVGLRTTYQRREGVHIFIRKLLALPFLPPSSIADAFRNLQMMATTPALRELTDYLERTWLLSSVWSPRNWSIYRQSVRTNNDVEGWHRRMNGKAGRANLPFYLLVPLLRRESATVDVQLWLVSENNLSRYQTTTYKRLQGKIFDLWDRYDGEDITTSSFLRQVGLIYAPAE